MEQKNQNEFLKLKNYSSFLFDLGLNVSFFQEMDIEVEQGKIEKKLKSIEDIDNYIKEWQMKNDFQLILRNKNISSKNILLLSEQNSFINFDKPKKKPELLNKMFLSIGQSIDEFFIINIDIEKLMENHISKIDEILELYFTILNPRVFIDMCSINLGKFFKLNKLNLNFDYFKIPSVSNIMKNQSLKREAWVELKLLKAKLNEFSL
ncbi:MAG: hypothetical protein EVA21_04120 [Alphaproteobacteria bacterium]|nr:MAG: hypothetical protein EVA21_04120 [Alphaproteobacteria bacterium]